MKIIFIEKYGRIVLKKVSNICYYIYMYDKIKEENLWIA